MNRGVIWTLLLIVVGFLVAAWATWGQLIFSRLGEHP